MASKVMLALLVVVSYAASVLALECYSCSSLTDDGCASGQTKSTATCTDIPAENKKAWCVYAKGVLPSGTKVQGRSCDWSTAADGGDICDPVKKALTDVDCKVCRGEKCNNPSLV